MTSFSSKNCTILTLAVRHNDRFVPEFGSVRGEAIAAMSEWRRKGLPRANLKIVASDLAAIEKAVAALNQHSRGGAIGLKGLLPRRRHRLEQEKSKQ